jgi:predicted small integral membrane protein
MRKLAILALAGLVLVTAAASFAAAPALNNQTDCNTNHMKCREYTLNVDEPWYKVMVLLTACDIAFGKCSLGL